MSRLKLLKQIPFNILVKRIIKRALPQKKIDYTKKDLRTLNSGIEFLSIIVVTKFKTSVESPYLSKYLNHDFNFLGSGWVSRNCDAETVVHKNHKRKTKDISSKIDETYKLLNWQKDIKSNFEFKAYEPFSTIIFGRDKNVDIKNCWELGRLQHLPQIALSAINKENDDLIKEFKNLCLDFIAYNPVGMGCQWACTMDVGIRSANMLIAYDIFKQIDTNNLLDDEFDLIFINSVYQHGVFIKNHLEHKEGAAGNHYLFNLIGLLFISNYLSGYKQQIEWQQFAEKELEKEMFKQFFKDGGNFEGSTTYHCLASEVILLATALMLRNGKVLDKKFQNLIFKLFQFTKDVIKPNGEFPQFGDNDSGRLFKFTTEDDNLLNYEGFLSGFSELFNENNRSTTYAEVVKQIIGEKHIKAKKQKNKIVTSAKEKQGLNEQKTTIIEFQNKIKLNDINSFCYPDFGIYGFKSDHFYLAVSGICNKKMHHSWGHVHNDKLSFDLQVYGKDLVRDPGTYTYSAYPTIRNKFRSTKAHHGIIVNGVAEQNNYSPVYGMLTYMDREIDCELLEFTDTSITIQAKYYGVKHIRSFEVKESCLIVKDSCNKPFEVNINQFKEYSPVYGEKQEVI